MKKLTETQKIINTIENFGFEEVPCRSKKYRQFKVSEKNSLFVGKRGALRYGRVATKSMSVNKESFFNRFKECKELGLLKK